MSRTPILRRGHHGTLRRRPPRWLVVLLTSRKISPSDLGQWRSLGVDPEGFFAVGIKASTEHRDAYGPKAAASYVLDLPGPCAANLGRLPFRNVRRPIYPLDGL